MEITYKIIGGDGEEYGPVTLAELKGWVVDGRVAGRTRVQRSGTEDWLPAARLTELQPEVGRADVVAEAAWQREAEAVGFWPRLGAHLVDLLVLYGPSLLLWGWLVKTFNLHPVDLSQITTGADLMKALPSLGQQALVSVCLWLVYSVPFNGRYGATLGKLMLGARIVRLDGTNIGYRLALIRFLGTQLSQLFLWAGYLLILFRPDKRALHDLIAGTRVIYRPTQQPET